MNFVSIEQAATNIINTFENENCYQLLVVGEGLSIHFRKKNTQYLLGLTKGEADYCRISDDKVVAHIKAPAMAGLICNNTEKNRYHYIKTTCASEFILVKYETGIKLIDDNGLWKDAFIICTEMTNISYKRDEICIARNVYEIVRHHIDLVWEMDQNTRASLSLFEFILKRTTVSRSSLSKILKALSVGGYIKTVNGRLVEKRKLPLSY